MATIDRRHTPEFAEVNSRERQREWDNGDRDYHPGPRKRSLQKLLRRTFEIQQDNIERDRSLKAVRAIIEALAKYPNEPGHACGIDCPCQQEKP